MITISQAANKTGLSVKSIRHYEEIKLIDTPPRDENGYRFYPDSLLKQLHFIVNAKQAGFNLQECKILLALSENEHRSSKNVKEIALQKIEEIEARIKQQQLLVQQLKKITKQCPGDQQSECAIIDAFSIDQ